MNFKIQNKFRMGAGRQQAVREHADAKSKERRQETRKRDQG